MPVTNPEPVILLDEVHLAELDENDPAVRRDLAGDSARRVGNSVRIKLSHNRRTGAPTVTLARSAKEMVLNLNNTISCYWTTPHRIVFTRTKTHNLVTMSNLGLRRAASSVMWRSNREDQPLRTQLRVSIHNTMQGFYINGSHISAERIDEIIAQAVAHLGGEPDIIGDRLPLLNEDHPDAVHKFAPDTLSWQPHNEILPWLDATDAKQVTMNLFGKRAYRRDLGRAVAAAPIKVLPFFATWRGLVPTDDLVGALIAAGDASEDPEYLNRADDLTGLRSLLRAIPEALRRRLLPMTNTYATQRQWFDIVTYYGKSKDLAVLTERIEAIGHRRVRDLTDLEQIMNQLPFGPKTTRAMARSETAQRRHTKIREAWQIFDQINRHYENTGQPELTLERWADPEIREQLIAEHQEIQARARQAEIEARAAQEEAVRQERLAREEARAAWAQEMTARLDGLVIDGMRIVVAKDAKTLAHWGTVMHNCIGGYHGELGLDILGAFVPADTPAKELTTAKPVLNVQITQERIVQVLGSYNRPVSKVLDGGLDAATSLFTQLSAVDGVTVDGQIWGLADVQSALSAANYREPVYVDAR